MKYVGKRPGAGRKPEYGESTISRSIFPSKDLDDGVIKDADKYGVSVNEIIVGNLYKTLMGLIMFRFLKLSINFLFRKIPYLAFTGVSPSIYKTNSLGEGFLPEKLTSRQKYLLAAMAAKPRMSFAPVQIQKFFFLLDENISKEIGGKQFKFQPHNFGPFDRQVYVEFDKLSKMGLAYPINRWDPPYQRRYALTPKGADQGRKELEKFSDVKGYIKKVADWIQSLGFAELVGAIYQEYPKMKVNSIFKEDSPKS